VGVAGESIASGFEGGDYDPGMVHCGELCCAKGIVTISPFEVPWWYFGAWQHVWNRVLWAGLTMFFVISFTLLINVNNVIINLTPSMEWIIPSLEV
jgi:hypothetical protein